jgi:cytoskeletal protein CcmA (bactofilin family)
MEYAAAKSTMCRQCGRSFSPSAPRPDLKPQVKEEVAAAQDPSLFKKVGGFWNRQQNSVVECFECKRKHEVSGAATSTNCPGCSAHIDLRDYKITTSFSRSIRTRGDVHITSKGDLSSTSVICRSAIVEGKLRGNLHCTESVTLDFSGKIPGRLTAKHMLVERKAIVQFFRRVLVSDIEIKGHVSAEIVAETLVTIHKNASLEGNVTAKGIRVEKGGVFSGQLVIGKANLTQAELLPEAKPVAAKDSKSEVPAAVAHPVPAT